MKIIKYPDGSSYVTVPSYGISAKFIFKINSYEDLWHLNQAIDAWNHRYTTRPTVFIPNLIDAQADRRFNDDESSGLKLVCKFLNSMDADFEIFHPHNPEVVEALMDNVKIIDNSQFISTVLYSLGKEYPTRTDDEFFETKQGLYIDRRVVDNTILMSSDAGGFKPLMKLCSKIGWIGETYSASKARSWNGTANVLFQYIDPLKDFDGKDILIVDDISIYGGTFKGLSKLLKARNCGRIYLAVSHMTVENLGEDPVTDYYDKVFTTNSKFQSYSVPNKKGEPISPKNLIIDKIHVNGL